MRKAREESRWLIARMCLGINRPCGSKKMWKHWKYVFFFHKSLSQPPFAQRLSSGAEPCQRVKGAMEKKVVLITGCSSGIGLSLAVRLASDPGKAYKGNADQSRSSTAFTKATPLREFLSSRRFVNVKDLLNSPRSSGLLFLCCVRRSSLAQVHCLYSSLTSASSLRHDEKPGQKGASARERERPAQGHAGHTPNGCNQHAIHPRCEGEGCGKTDGHSG